MLWYRTNLAEYVNDWFQLEGGKSDSNSTIAEAYLEQEPATDGMSEAEFDQAVKDIIPQVAYYTEHD